MNKADCKSLGEAICLRLAGEIEKLGFPPASLPPSPVYCEATFGHQKDPYSGEESLIGIWKNPKGRRIGEIKFHADGSFYAECDLALAHPSDARWFVESVTAWGKGDTIKAEAKLLPAL